MEIIKNYLETMFANMPNTEAVRKAKDELGQMMEDKYEELIAEGKTENEAVGTVISEFGNLDELAGDLGLEEEVVQEKEYTANTNARFVSLDEVKEYFSRLTVNTRRLSIAILLYVISVTGPILTTALDLPDAAGVCAMFTCIAVGIGLNIYSVCDMSSYRYIRRKRICVDMMTSQYASDAKRQFEPAYNLMKTLGIVCCAMCWLPTAALCEFEALEEAAIILLFVLVAVGAYLIVYATRIHRGYDRILQANDRSTMGGYYYEDQPRVYTNQAVATIMEVYKPTVLCIYLIWSFLTFDWYITWIIWPVAAIVKKIIDMNLTKEETADGRQ